MKKMFLAIAAGLLLALPAACIHHSRHGASGESGCPQHQSCDCKCRHRPDCPKQQDCPEHGQQEPPPPAK